MKAFKLRQLIARAFTTGETFALGLTTFHVEPIDGVSVLRAANWHGSASVIASWYPRAANDSKALALAIWDNRRHYRKPFPLADHYKRPVPV